MDRGEGCAENESTSMELMRSVLWMDWTGRGRVTSMSMMMKMKMR